MSARRGAGALLVLGLLAAAAGAEGPRRESRAVDPLAPADPSADPLVRQLHTATLITSDLRPVRDWYVDGLGLTLEGPLELDAATRAIQRRLWDIPEPIGWRPFLLHRPGAAGTVRIRLLVLDRPTPSIRDAWNALQPGPFSLGFPADELASWDADLRRRGHRSLNPMSVYRVPRPGGGDYGMHETIWKAPDFVHSVTLSRRDGMPQLGPTDPATGRGGPVYSAQVVEGSDRVLAFYTDVLGFEVRSDREWRSHGATGALAVPDGTVFRFAILYAPGAAHGHLLFVDFRARGLPASGAAPRPPNRGLAAWTFPVRDLAEVRRRLDRHGVPAVAGPLEYHSPTLGRHRALTVLAPNGFLVELVEGVSSRPPP